MRVNDILADIFIVGDPIVLIISFRIISLALQQYYYYQFARGEPWMLWVSELH